MTRVADDFAAAAVRRLLTPEGLADPYSIYREIREAQAATEPSRFLVSFTDVQEAAYDRELSSDRVSSILKPLGPTAREDHELLHDTLRSIVVFLDQPAHGRVRRLLLRAFTSRMVDAQQPAIDRAVAGLLDEAGRQERPDLVRTLTYPLPAVVVGEMLGIPAEDRDRFQQWALDIVLVVGSGTLTQELAERAERSVAEMRAFMADLVARRRTDPGPDLLSAMIAANEDGDRLSEDELFANALFLMTAGHETATNMLSNAILTLLRHPDQLELLRSDWDGRLDATTEECLRYEGPVQVAARIADRDREFRGRHLRKGQSLVLMLGAANRDPEQFEDPDRFDISRAPQPHLAFSHGPHFCLGAALARAEMKTVLPALFERYPALRLARDEVTWQPTLDFRGPDELVVSLT